MSNTTFRTLPLSSPQPARQDPLIPLVHALAGATLAILGALLMLRSSVALSNGLWGLPNVLGAVHAFTIGWLLTLVTGTLYQLGPVALRTPSRSTSAWRIILPIHLLGALIVIWGTSSAKWHTAAHGWSLVLLALLASMVIQLGPFRAPENTRNRMRMVTLAFVFLLLALTVAGARLAWGWRGFTPDLSGIRIAHIALGLVGFGTLMAWAIGTHVLPMFLGARARSSFAMKTVPWLLGTGSALTIPSISTNLQQVRILAILVMACGQLLMVWEMRYWFASRAKKEMDPALTLAAIATVFLSLASTLQIALAALSIFDSAVSPLFFNRLITVWGLFMLPGWLSLLIAGVLYRVAPFLSWLHRAGPDSNKKNGSGSNEAPQLRVAQFSRPRLAWYSVVALAIGTVLAACGVLTGKTLVIQSGLILYTSGTIALGAHHMMAVIATPRLQV